MRWRPQCGGCGLGHACQFVKLYIESRDKLRNMRTHNCPALQVITCDAVNNNWEKSAQSTAPPVYNLRIITKIEWLFVEINLHKTFLSDKVILWPWKRTRPRRLSRTQKAYFTYKHRVFTHTWSVLCDVARCRRLLETKQECWISIIKCPDFFLDLISGLHYICI